MTKIEYERLLYESAEASALARWRYPVDKGYKRCHEDGFIAGGKWANAHWQARVKVLLHALEVYAMTNETFPEYGDVARKALKDFEGSGG